jgi:hypothetical protein
MKKLDILYENVLKENTDKNDLLDAIQSYVSSSNLKRYRVWSRSGNKLSIVDEKDNIYELIIK